MPYVFDKGHWREVILPEMEDAALKSELDSLSREERALLEDMVREVEEKGTKGDLVQKVVDLEYEVEPVDIRSWLEDPRYFGNIGSSLWPSVKKSVIEIIERGCVEVILTGAIGTGKSLLSQVLACRYLYELLCLRNPQASLGQAPGSPIVFSNLAVRKDIAQRVVFEGIVAKLEWSPWFKSVGYERRAHEIIFPKNIRLMGGESTDTSILAQNIVFAIVEEANFMEEVRMPPTGNISRWYQQYSRADLLYSGLVRRMKSRFMQKGKVSGMIVLVSSKQTPTDFTERRIREGKDDPTVYVSDIDLWSAKRDAYSEETFKVLVGNESVRSKILEGPEGEGILKKLEDADKEYDGCYIIDVPVDFKKDFQRNIDEALRDIAGISTIAIHPYMQDLSKIHAIVDPSREHPFSVEFWDPTKEGRFLWDKLVVQSQDGFQPRLDPDAPRVIGIDPSLRVDATGFCMAHVGGFIEVVRRTEQGKETRENAPVIVVDFILRIIPPESGEIIYLPDVRNLVYQLAERGFHIKKITMDSFNSPESIHTFKLKGFDAEILSVDANIEPYAVLRNAIYEGRVKCYDYPWLLKELRELEFDAKRKKVNHQPKGGKDLADSLAQVVFTLTKMFQEGQSPALLVKGNSEYTVPPGSLAPTGDLQWPKDENEGLVIVSPVGRLGGSFEFDDEEVEGKQAIARMKFKSLQGTTIPANSRGILLKVEKDGEKVVVVVNFEKHGIGKVTVAKVEEAVFLTNWRGDRRTESIEFGSPWE